MSETCAEFGCCSESSPYRDPRLETMEDGTKKELEQETRDLKEDLQKDSAHIQKQMEGGLAVSEQSLLLGKQNIVLR